MNGEDRYGNQDSEFVSPETLIWLGPQPSWTEVWARGEEIRDANRRPRYVPYLAKSLRSQSRRAPLSRAPLDGKGAIYRRLGVDHKPSW